MTAWGYLLRQHPLVMNTSFENRFVECIYLRADHDSDTPCICMYCKTSRSELLVQDLHSSSNEFPFWDPSSCAYYGALQSFWKISVTYILTMHMTTNWSPQKQCFKSRPYTYTDASCQYNKGHDPGRPRAHHFDCSFRWSFWKANPNSGDTYKCVFNTCVNTCHWRNRPRW